MFYIVFQIVKKAIGFEKKESFKLNACQDQ
jgi:hypothetical protein